MSILGQKKRIYEVAYRQRFRGSSETIDYKSRVLGDVDMLPFLSRLERELKRQELGGKPCVRVFFDSVTILAETVDEV